jgi:hypothetical protein
MWKNPYVCKKCKQFNNWFHGYCFWCWGDLPQKQQSSILLREALAREDRKLQRKSLKYGKETNA